MSSKTNEMDSAAYVAAASTAPDTMPTLPPSIITKDDGTPPDHEINMDVSIDNPTSNHDLKPEDISVYANTINPVSYMGDGNIVSFDVVFSVSIPNAANGSLSTYQVVKRIGVDKMKMANDAKMSTPISIVEAKKPTINLTTERFKALAGIK